MASAALVAVRDTTTRDAPLDQHISIEEPLQRPSAGALGLVPESRGDADAQTTVTDFLDFTEYLPSDIVRSLTLIGKLDEAYVDASSNAHHLTQKWGQLPTLAAAERPSPVQLRADISEQLNQAVSSRVSSHAEAVKMSENINRHYQKVKILLSKLQAMMQNYPTDQEIRDRQLSKSPQLSRAKLAGKAGGDPAQKPRRQQRAPKITVPGEVLAPYEIEYDNFTDDSGDSSEDNEDGAEAARTPGPAPKIKLIANKIPKTALSRPTPRAAPQTTAAAELAAAINAAALLRPPPPDAVIGSPDAPWLQLTQYELAKLRKRMKKNAAWTPSETMVARELKALSRGPEDYRAAKKKAEEEGKPFEPSVPAPVVDSRSGTAQLPAGAISADSLAAEEVPTSNRGMKLNEAKKLKREALAKLAAEEAEESARKTIEATKVFRGNGSPTKEVAKDLPPIIAPAKAAKTGANSRSNVKRKREVNGDGGSEHLEAMDAIAAAPQAKRTKTETPVPPPLHGKSRTYHASTPEVVVPPSIITPNVASTKQTVPPPVTPVPVPLPPQSSASSAAVAKSPTPVSSAGLAVTVTTSVPVKPPGLQTPVPVPRADRRRSSTAVAPPAPSVPSSETGKRETRGEAAKRAQQEQEPSPKAPLPAPEPPITRRASLRGTSPVASIPTPEAPLARRPGSRGKAASQEPQPSVLAERSQRTSTARNTPAPEVKPPLKRTKRPAPGIVSTTSSGGSSAVGKRKSAPKKKARITRKDKDQTTVDEMEEVDDEGKPIPEDEPKYCICNRVSFGTMIRCDNEVRDVEEEAPLTRTLRSSINEENPAHKGCRYEWFHLECVGLQSEPAETTKWYCPECREVLGIGGRGTINARGVKR